MKDQWRSNSVNLDSLSHSLEKFLTENHLKIETEKTNEGYKIAASGLHFKLTVRVLGAPDDFAVEFDPDRKTSGFVSPKMFMAYIGSLFGAGKLFLKEVELQRDLAELEDKFWEYVDAQIEILRNSA